MRYLALLLLLLGSLSAAQDSHDTHGKTEADILQMGLDKWTNFFTSKEGDSTASMTEAAGIYSNVAVKRDDRLLKALHDDKARKRFLKLRGLMNTFASSSVDAGYCESEGGTMFNTMWAAAPGIVEDMLYRLISHSGGKSKSIVVSTVKRQLAKIRRDFEDMRKDDPKGQFFKYKDALDAMAKLNQSFDAIVAVAKSMSRSDSDRLLGFCLEQARNVDFN